MYSRSARTRRAAAAGAAAAAAAAAAATPGPGIIRFRRRTLGPPNRASGIRLPTSGSARYLYGSGVPGSTRYIRPAPGRDAPLYAPVRSAGNYQEMRVFPSSNLDALPASFAFSDTGTITHLNVIRQADDIAARQGSRVQMQNLIIRGYVTPAAVPTANVNLFYGSIFIVYDRSPNGVLPAITDILTTATPQSMQRVDYRDRFRILWRQHFLQELTLVYNGTGLTTAATADSIRPVDVVVPVNSTAVYDSSVATGVIASMRTGSLLLMTVGRSAVAASELLATLTFRLTFTDL